MLNSIIEAYHGINLFLSSNQGYLSKLTVELFLFFLMTYMVLYRYKREEEKKQLWYMTLGFSIIFLQKLILTLGYVLNVFSTVTIQSMPFFINLTEGIEALGLVFLTGSFIYPLYWRNHHKFKKVIRQDGLFVLLLFIITQLVIVIQTGNLIVTKYLANTHFYFHAFKIAIIYITVAMLINNSKKMGRYNILAIEAFLLYSVKSIISIINIVFFFNSNMYLRVIETPFPFFALFAMLRLIYLKLADEAKLKQDLEITKQRYKHAKEIGRLRDEFVSIVSHELRTPLTSIKLYASLMRDNKFGKITKKQKETMEVIASESTRLNNLINDLLDLSRFEKGKAKLKRQKVNLHNYINKVVPINLTEEKNIEFCNKIPKKLIVRLDPEKMHQVIINLFSNALKYTPNNGKIILSARQFKNYYEIYVKDTGIGIPKEKISKLFLKFYQIEDHMTRNSKGIGLGLSIVKHIIDLHQGEIEVYSQVKEGTLIVIRLPNNIEGNFISLKKLQQKIFKESHSKEILSKK